MTPVHMARTLTWSALEIDLGVICACLPGMRLLISSLPKARGFRRQLDSIHRPRTFSSKETPSLPSDTGQASSHGSQSAVRITTTIQLHPCTSETSVSLKSMEGRGRLPSGVISRVWA
jgi:hypothetical protein